MAKVPPLPNFLIIGAQRCATRWLRYNLDQHPDIYMPPFEMNFWDEFQNLKTLRVGGYRRQFAGWNDEPFTGESSPVYLMWEHDPASTAELIQLHLPDVKLIAMVRDPIHRLESAFLHYVKLGRIGPDETFTGLLVANDPRIKELQLLSAGIYAYSLEPYIDRFGEDLLVIFHDDLVADPESVYLDALDHIGVTRLHVPKGVHRVMYSARTTVRSEHPMFEGEGRANVWEWYRDDVRFLSELTGRDLSHWGPDHPHEP